MTERLREWSLELYVVGAVFSVGVIELSRLGGPYNDSPYVLLVGGMMLAAGLSRKAPGVAVGLIWLICALQVVNDMQLKLVQLAVVMVAFGSARWGSRPVLVFSALSMPVGALIGVASLGPDAVESLIGTVGYDAIAALGTYSWGVITALAGAAVLGVPWLAGLTLRFRERARESRASQVAAEEGAARAEVAAEQSREIAELREDQARLARDVHDVVGHSLAVILAQAESAQYLRDADTEKLKQTMENIATSARSSLQDVRHVLTPSKTEQARPGSLDALVAGVNESGHEVVSSEVGSTQPLPPELEVVAYRVLQEMLTNAIKHGRRDEPVFVERHWEGELRIEVRNVIDTTLDGKDDLPDSTPGQGLEGMRRRLDSVGGRLDVRRREVPSGATFTATAWVPVRSR
jgi:signal transduction histidine kinase